MIDGKQLLSNDSITSGEDIAKMLVHFFSHSMAGSLNMTCHCSIFKPHNTPTLKLFEITLTMTTRQPDNLLSTYK